VFFLRPAAPGSSNEAEEEKGENEKAPGKQRASTSGEQAHINSSSTARY
jgi:hypothetical protein